MDDHQFALLLAHMKYSWQGFRKVRKGVKKRVVRHMQEIGCRDIDAYLQRISVDKAVRAECERVMTVSISRFFRDRQMWEILEARVLPDLVKRDGSAVRVWFAGCAGGEELYSFRILWENFVAGYKTAPQLTLIATDLNPANLERAKIGCYPGGSLREVDERFKASWFAQKKKNEYAIAPCLQEGISWQVHDLITDPPPGEAFDIVFMRNNLLTYFQAEMIQKSIERVAGALAPDGFLIIGAKEEMPEAGEVFFRQWDRCIYRKKGCQTLPQPLPIGC